MTSLIPPTPEQQRERQRIEKLIRDRMQNTLGNEYKKSTQRVAKLNKLRDTFLDKSLKSGKYRAAAEYMANIKRFNAMPDSFKQRATPPRPSREVSQQMATINRRYNTLVRRDYKNDLAAIDKFEKRFRQFEHDLRLKHDKGYRPNRGGGFFGLFGSRPEDREGFRTWAAQNDPEFYKRQQRFIKKYGEDPQKYTSFIPGLPTQRDIREEAAYSRRFINREEYDKARADAFKRYNEYKRKQPRKPYKPPPFKVNPILPNSAFTPATLKQTYNTKNNRVSLPNRSQQQTQALFDAQRAQFLRQQEAANKLKPIKTTTTTTSKPAKPIQPVMSSAPKQQPIKRIKSGGKVTKKYANGGSVRKPKYKG